MLRRIFIFFICIIFLGSCAIHDKFPFVCFRWSCISAEFKLPHWDVKGAKKQMKTNASIRKKKRLRKKNKRLAKRGKPPIPDNTSEQNQEAVKKDSLKYRFHALKEDRYIIISFDRKDPLRTDSIYVRYNADEDDVLDYDKQYIRNYIDSNKVENIIMINVKEHFGDMRTDQQENKHTSITKEHIASYLMKLGVIRERIKLSHRK